jgi:hypothetical protein
MATLVYKMTHRGDPNSDLGCWGVADCMGQVRGYPFDAVIGIGGRSWWTNQTSRVGEIVWIGIGPHRTSVEGKCGPEVTFDHFRSFSEGELMLSEIAPNLNRSMYTCRFRLNGFSRAEEQEIERICELAMSAGPSACLTAEAPDTPVDDEECRRTVCRRWQP